MDFEEIVAGLDLEPIATTIVRNCLKEDYTERHPGSDCETAEAIIDEVVDDLRVYFGDGGFDDFVCSQVGR